MTPIGGGTRNPRKSTRPVTYSVATLASPAYNHPQLLAPLLAGICRQSNPVQVTSRHRPANPFRSVCVMAESYQEKLKRVRPPRVMIDYKVETEGAEPILELPFVVGVMADLSGDAKRGRQEEHETAPVCPDRPRQLQRRDESAGPPPGHQGAEQADRRRPDKLAVELNFKSMDDFEPARIAEQVPALNELLTMRKKLTELLEQDGRQRRS